jgi:cation diffusion facilitator CzcD-associated flavoprotein CzcO
MAEPFRLIHRCTDDRPPIRVICIGAGLSGILTAIRLPQRVPGVELKIYEKNSDIGGTWFQSDYPGRR